MKRNFREMSMILEKNERKRENEKQGKDTGDTVCRGGDTTVLYFFVLPEEAHDLRGLKHAQPLTTFPALSLPRMPSSVLPCERKLYGSLRPGFPSLHSD